MSHAENFLQTIQANPNLLKRVQTAQTEVLQAIAQELGITLTPAELQLVQSRLNDEISEEMLSDISGGGGLSGDSSTRPGGPGIKG